MPLASGNQARQSSPQAQPQHHPDRRALIILIAALYFNGRLRDECLNEHLFGNLSAARRIHEAWRIDSNVERPHTSLDGLTPAAFATCPTQGHTENGLCL